MVHTPFFTALLLLGFAFSPSGPGTPTGDTTEDPVSVSNAPSAPSVPSASSTHSASYRHPAEILIRVEDSSGNLASKTFTVESLDSSFKTTQSTGSYTVAGSNWIADCNDTNSNGIYGVISVPANEAIAIYEGTTKTKMISKTYLWFETFPGGPYGDVYVTYNVAAKQFTVTGASPGVTAKACQKNITSYCAELF